MSDFAILLNSCELAQSLYTSLGTFKNTLRCSVQFFPSKTGGLGFRWKVREDDDQTVENSLGNQSELEVIMKLKLK